MKAIILAAGSGRRLRFTFPKSLIQINGRSIFYRIIDRLRECGIKDITTITGFESDLFTNEMTKYYINKSWYYTEELYSLCCARDIGSDDCLVLHSDIIFDNSILESVIKSKGDIISTTKGIESAGIFKFSKQIMEQIFEKHFLSLNEDIEKTKNTFTIEDIVKYFNNKKYIKNIIEISNSQMFFNINTRDNLVVVREKFEDVVMLRNN